MNNLIKTLLELKFPTIDSNNLLEVINATTNPLVAAETMCGIYQEPEIKHLKCTDRYSPKRILIFEQYDKWTSKVHYKYQQHKSAGYYFPKSLDLSTVNKDNYLEFKVEYNSNSEIVHHIIILDELETKNSSMSIEDWNKNTPVHDELDNNLDYKLGS
jgi:hypothetical protein